MNDVHPFEKTISASCRVPREPHSKLIYLLARSTQSISGRRHRIGCSLHVSRLSRQILHQCCDCYLSPASAHQARQRSGHALSVLVNSMISPHLFDSIFHIGMFACSAQACGKLSCQTDNGSNKMGLPERGNLSYLLLFERTTPLLSLPRTSHSTAQPPICQRDLQVPTQD